MQRCKDFDLAADTKRMKDPRDGRRQHATVDALLGRLFAADRNSRWELQIVADEVGMGKTFVALGAAYSVLAAMKRGQSDEDLAGCYRKVLILTPPNSGLFDKWSREVGEFVKRCVRQEHQADARRWFASKPVNRWDELAAELRRTGVGPAVLIGQMSLFGGGKVRDYDLKRRLMLGLICNYWSVKFRHEDRARLLKGAPSGWPSDPTQLLALTEAERARIPLGDAELRYGIERLDNDGDLDGLLATCKEISLPYVRDRGALFKKVERGLMEVYQKANWLAIRQAIPLLIVDEAHHWKNGPSSGARGYKTFAAAVASRTRRAILLTATPFQLRPEEMLELFKIGEQLAATPNEQAAAQRRERLIHHRQQVLQPALRNSELASQAFAKGWSRLPRQVTAVELGAAWADPRVVQERAALRAYANEPGVVETARIIKMTAGAAEHLDPSVREIVRLGLQLFAANLDLSSELATVVIRHRRLTHHRAFLVGAEYELGVDSVIDRQDRSVLHGAPGLDVRGEGELPHYLLMRCISEVKAREWINRSKVGVEAPRWQGARRLILPVRDPKSNVASGDGSASKTTIDPFAGPDFWLKRSPWRSRHRTRRSSDRTPRMARSG